MSKPIDEIEKAWEKWVYAKTKGLVKGDFPYAEQLLEYRKAQARILHRELIHLVPDKKGQRWPDRRKRRKSKMQKQKPIGE